MVTDHLSSGGMNRWCCTCVVTGIGGVVGFTDENLFGIGGVVI